MCLFFSFFILFCNIQIMLLMLIHKGKWTEMILQIAPVTLKERISLAVWTVTGLVLL